MIYSQEKYNLLKKYYDEIDLIFSIRVKLNDSILSKMGDDYTGQEARNDMLDFLNNEYKKLQDDINDLND
mgnify:FL=1